MPMIKAILLTVAALLLLPLTAASEFYQYEDENGTVNFTDDPAKIPKKLKKKKKTRDDDQDGPGSSVTKVSIKGNQVLVPVTVAYRGKEVKATFLLDTGATTCTISPDLANRLEINPEDADASLAQGVGGSVFLVGHTKLEYVVVGPNRKYDIDVSVIPSGRQDGLLGMNFLRELRYHVDFNSHTIRWGD
jgi:clan AA aspartic protease (TIGR02281 family)